MLDFIHNSNLSKKNPILYTPLFIIKYMWIYVRISTFWPYRNTHSRIFILRLNSYVLYICNLFEAHHSLVFLLHLKQEHEERERFLHHLRIHKYCCVNTVIFRLYKIHKTCFNSVVCSQYNVPTLNIILHFVISVIKREKTFIFYVYFASWSNNLKYFIFLPQI